MCVGVTVWFGWGGVISLCRLQPLFNYQDGARSNKHMTLYLNLPPFLKDVKTFFQALYKKYLKFHNIIRYFLNFSTIYKLIFYGGKSNRKNCL